MKKFISSLLCASVVMGAMAMPAFAEDSARVYVATFGDDRNNGSALTSAVKSLGRAQELVELYANDGKKVEVIIKGGIYTLDDTLNVSASGTAEAPIIYRAYGNGTDVENVIITAGNTIDTTTFQETDTENLYVTELPEEDFPEVTGGISDVLYSDGELLPFARFETDLELPLDHFETKEYFNPDTGEYWDHNEATWLKIPDQYASRWTNATNMSIRTNQDYARGFIDATVENGLIRTTSILPNGIVSAQYSSCSATIFGHIVDADTEGEYYIDAENRLLYLYTEKGISEYTDMYLATGDAKKTAISAIGVSNIKFENLNVIAGKNYGLYFNDCENITVYGSKIHATGKEAVYVVKGKNIFITQCDIGELPGNAVYLAGGDQPTLTDSGIKIANCDIHHYGQISIACQGIKLGTTNYRYMVDDAVGIEVVHNNIHDAPAQAISIQGNNNIIEYNRFYNLTKEVWDGGMVYSGRSWTEIGNQINYNFMYNTVEYMGDWSSVGDLYTKETDRTAVYLDDLQSGETIKGNIVYNYVRGFQVGGGSFNTIEDNLVLETRRGWIIDQLAFRLDHADPANTSSGKLYYRTKELMENENFNENVWDYQAFRMAQRYVNNIDEATTDAEKESLKNGIYPIRGLVVKNNYYAGSYADLYKVGNYWAYLQPANVNLTDLTNGSCEITDSASSVISMDNFTVDKSSELYQITVNDNASVGSGVSKTTANMGILRDENGDIVDEDGYVPADTSNDYQIGDANRFKAVAAIYDGDGKLMGTTTYQSTEGNDVAYIYNGQEFTFDVDVPDGATSAWYMNMFVWSADGLMRPLATKTPLITQTSAQ